MEIETLQNYSAASSPAIDGVFNVREFGGYCSGGYVGTTRKGFIYRSGHLDNITVLGRQDLSDLGISTIIDLRSDDEDKLSARLYAPTRHNDLKKPANGCKVASPRKVRLPLDGGQFAPTRKLQLYRNATSESSELIANEYFRLITATTGVLALKSVLLNILEHPDERFLIHCTLGKDRTGIIFGLLLSLARVSDVIVAEEYAISQPQLKSINSQVRNIVRMVDSSATEENAALDADHILEAKSENMLLLIQKIRQTFGGVHEFVRDICGFPETDIARIQSTLLEE